MANKLFGLNIAKIVSGAMPGMHAGTLSSANIGGLQPGNPGGGQTVTYTPIRFKGFASTFKKSASGLVVGASHTVLMLAGTMPDGAEPKPYDKITFDVGTDPELGGKVAIIVEQGVERDPASATWTCHVQA